MSLNDIEQSHSILAGERIVLRGVDLGPLDARHLVSASYGGYSAVTRRRSSVGGLAARWVTTTPAQSS